jgi:phosphoribosylamine-glycine ligase
MTRGYSNITEMMFRVAGGEDVTPKPVAKACAEIIVWTAEANDKDVAVTLKDKDMNRVLLRQFGKVDGQLWRTHHGDGTLIAECIGFGDTVEEAEQQARESVELVDFEGKSWEKDVFEQMDEKLDKARKFGIWPKDK